MTPAILKKSIPFYAILFALWAAFLLVKFHDHRYIEDPVPSAGLGESGGTGADAAPLQAKVTELRQKLAQAATGAARASVLQEIGYAYADLFNAVGNVAFRDSAVACMRGASEEDPGNGRLHYSLGRFYAALGDAKGELEQDMAAIRCDPANAPALADAAACSYFNLHQSASAAHLATKALALDPHAPMCRLVLGLVALDGKKADEARADLEQEIASDYAILKRDNQATDIRFAVATAHYTLMLLFCNYLPDKAKAREHLAGYLKLEPDASRRSAAVDMVKQRWGN